MRRSISLFAVALVLVLSMASFAFGQNTGSVVGTVMDNTGAVIPGVAVSATNQETGAESSTTSDQAGNYQLTLLRAGTYQIIATTAGFQRLQRDNVTVANTEVLRVDLALEVGVVTETVTVVAETPLLQSEQATLGHVVDERSITSIPLATRNFTQILGTSPGVVGAIMNADRPGTGSASVSVNGARRGSNNIQVDGAPTSNQLNNAPDGDGTPSIEFLSEFKVLTSLYTAEFGRNQGSIINVTTRAGTNTFHGSAYEFLRNTQLNARPFFFPERRPSLQNQFGANIGGPIVRDRTFFFFGWESSRQINGNGSGSRLRTRVPTADEANGIFGDGRNILDPAAKELFPNGTIPQSRINQVSRNIQQAFFPAPNLVDPGSDRNFEAFQAQPTDLNQYTVRVDHRFGDNDSINGRWFESFQEDLSPFSRGMPSFGNLANREKHTWGFSYTKLFSPTLIMEARVSGDYTDQFTLGSNGTPPSTVGLQPIDGVTYADDVAGMPRIRVDNYFGSFGNRSNWSDFIDRYAYAATFTYLKGSHNFKFGLEHHHSLLNPQNNLTTRGEWRFRGEASGDEYADFLLTYPQSKTFGASDSFGIGGELKLKSNYWGFFFTDDWKVTSKLTVNWGFRYDLDFQAGAHNLAMVSFYPENYRGLDGTIESTGIVQGGINGVPLNTLDGDWNNIMPRLGIAWRVTDKWVIRTGAGQYFDLRTGQIAQQAFANPPTFTSVSEDCRPGKSTLCNYTDPGNWLYFNPGHQSGVVPFPTEPNQKHPLRATERKVLTDNAWQWNFALQRELAPNLIFETAYIGTNGTHLNMRFNVNPEIPVSGLDTPLDANVGPLTRLYPGFGNISYVNQNGSSTYHSFQSSLKRRAGSSTFQLSYTFGKTLGDGNDGSRFKTSSYAAPWNNWSAAKGPANFDRTHRMTIMFNHDLPKAFDSGIGAAVFNNWAINGFFVGQTGSPRSVTNNNSGRGLGGSNSSPSATNLPSNVVKSGNLVRSGTDLDNYFVDGAFEKASRFTYGNAGRGIFRGPGQWNMDFSTFKNIPISERFNLQFRAEFFNLFNHANFGNPQSDLDSGSFGTIRSTSVNARLVQFALKLSF